MTRRRGNPNFRPLSDDERTVRVMVSMPASLRDWIREQPGSSDSERARRCIEHVRSHEELFGERRVRLLDEAAFGPEPVPSHRVHSDGYRCWFCDQDFVVEAVPARCFCGAPLDKPRQ